LLLLLGCFLLFFLNSLSVLQSKEETPNCVVILAGSL
jgi:hypothetical protein